ncbi:uncharacterized protein LOC114435595 [Parambassis ranga]|uniref:Uncharacterized protein LOC114435595 n=1 Tax=Parambassis ranga TaxID=210632 RepID=A0A6P7I5K2_9TELE|nr:uncharacterized protein LOC114435595 [Parambassis ranga]
MRTFCVAVIVLSLLSVGQPAPLTCETLMKPRDTEGPDLTGRWFLLALSAEHCITTTLLDVLLRPIFVFDITSMDASNVYNSSIKITIDGHCFEESKMFFYKDNQMFEVDSNNTALGNASLFLYSGCPDCIVVKRTDMIKALILISRRKVVTAAELAEFETQARCLGWSKPQVLRAEHASENCRSYHDIPRQEDEAIMQRIHRKVSEKATSMREKIMKCFIEFWVFVYNTVS